MSCGSGVTPGGAAPSFAARIATAFGGRPGPNPMPFPSGPTIASARGGSGAPRPTRACAAPFAQTITAATAIVAVQSHEGDIASPAPRAIARRTHDSSIAHDLANCAGEVLKG